jgi:hypothetical protein
MKRTHVGGKLTNEIGSEIASIDHMLSSETRKASDKAVFMQVRDVVKAAFNKALFDARTDKMAHAAGDKIEGDPIKTIELASKKFGLSELVAKSVQRHGVEGGMLNRLGISCAVTRAAADVESYDLASELETLGGSIIEMPKTEWRELATAE